MNFILCYVLYSLSTWVYPKYLLWVVKSHQHIAEVHLELLSILTSGETALLLSLICLARSNTKWVEHRYSLLFMYKKWLLQCGVQHSTGKKKGQYKVLQKKIICYLWTALCAEWKIYEKKYLKHMHRTRAICLNNLKYNTKYMHSFHSQNRHSALGFVISVLLGPYCGLTTKPAQALKKSNNKAQ